MNKKILLLEDDHLLAQTLEELLQESGYEVVLVCSGDKAADVSHEQNFDLYIFDINVPKISGIELLEVLRNNDDKTPAIFISALVDLESITKAFEIGADEYIKKPFFPEELLLRVKARLGSAKKIKTLEEELEKTKQESKEDFLTKLYNKRALDEFMNIQEEEFLRYKHNYTIVMFDIDYFKRINDTYGHDAGDIILSSFANILKEEARIVDIVGRFGGEEFMVVLRDTDLNGGFIFAEKVRKSVEITSFMYQTQSIKVTVSSGISERKNSVSLQNVIKLADDRLYKAKDSGRNLSVYK